MKKSILFLFALVMMQISGCAQSADRQAQHNRQTEKKIDDCEEGWCELIFEGIPSRLSWQTTIAPSNEPGEPLIISGTIYKLDGKTPAPGVILYVHHTDNKGYYSPAPNQTQGIRHGHLRGWMKTDANGRYEFKTIRPKAYPDRSEPQHIHPIISEPGKGYYWIDDYLFEDDPLLTNKERSRARNRGGNGIISLEKNEKGVWTGRRDIILGKNVPNY
ncbi:MAG: intradiol ring-cleavage dioxygenase [Cyclobacteriaceae bacterium]|nr:intradiol ring-cleavage dioxygenase [Cyclobacteriaceae bacterium]